MRFSDVGRCQPPTKGSPVASAVDGKLSYIQVTGGVCGYFSNDASVQSYVNSVGACKGTAASTIMKAVVRGCMSGRDSG